MKNQKPTDIEASLKYICNKCGASHWLFLREAKAENFKIVCECNNIFIVSQIISLNIEYKDTTTTTIENSEDYALSQSIIDTCTKTLLSLGYNKTEAITLINEAYINTNTKDSTTLIKNILQKQPIGV
jgi:Holliday junction resolvasome RuvABC DNA-binding subunit